MDSIIEGFKNGNGKERLAILADLFSIAGFSIATIVGALVGTNKTHHVSKIDLNQIIGAVLFSLAYLAILALVMALLLAGYPKLARLKPNGPYVHFFVLAFYWLLVAFAAIFAGAFYFDYISSMHFLIPTPEAIWQ